MGARKGPRMVGETIRELRVARGLSQTRLAELLCTAAGRATFTRNDISRYERGHRVPSGPTLRALATALDVPLGDLEAPRLAAARAHPGPDRVLRRQFTDMLARQRRAEDTRGAQPLYATVATQRAMIATLARESGRDWLPLLFSHDQFLGWMAVDLGRYADASAHYRSAQRTAAELNDPDMLVSTRSMRSQLAWLVGDAHAATRMCEGMQGATATVRALLDQQRARALAMTGDVRGTDSALLSAERALEKASNRPEWTYFYDPVRLGLQRGLAYLSLGRYRAAAELLGAVENMPGEYRRDRARYLALWSTALSGAGQREQARSVLARARAVRVRSHIVSRELARAECATW